MAPIAFLDGDPGQIIGGDTGGGVSTPPIPGAQNPAPTGGGQPGTTTGTTDIQTGVPANPFGTENGGVGGTTWVLFFPVKDISSGLSYIGYFDVNNSNDSKDDSSYSYRAEDIALLRQPTVRRVGLVYRDLGAAAITITLSGTNDQAQVVSQSVTAQIGNTIPTNDLMIKLVDIQLTAFHPQLTISRAAGAGPVCITSATIIGEVEEQQL